MKPPPPRLPASGRVTASAKPTATAASTALPPRRENIDADLAWRLFLRRNHAVQGDGGAEAREPALARVVRAEWRGETEDNDERGGERAA